MNPARDLMPRLLHWHIIKNESYWNYAWVPIIGPIIGAVVGAIVGNAFVKL